MEVVFEEEGKYNIVLMSPSGWGAGFFSGYSTKSKKISWGIPVTAESGDWRFIAVNMNLETSDTIHETVNLHLDLKKINRKQKEIETALEKLKTIDQKIEWQILDPNFDLVCLFPILWLKGIGPKNGELIINNDSRFIETDENNIFWEPIKLKPGAQKIVFQGRTESIDFSHEINVFYLDTSISENIQFRKSFTNILEITGKYDPNGETNLIETKNGDIDWIFPPDEMVTLAKNIEIKGFYNEKIKDIEINDGNNQTISIDRDTNSFDSLIPIKIGTSELVLKIKDEENEIIDILTRNINVQIEENQIPSLHILRPKNGFVITDDNDSLKVEGFTTPGAIVSIGKQKSNTDSNGYFEIELRKEKIIKKDNTITIKVKSLYPFNNQFDPNKYDMARHPDLDLDLFWEFSDDLKILLKEMSIDTLDHLRIADLRPLTNKGHKFSELLRLVRFANLLLISKNNLSIFTTVEAFLLSKLGIQSLEAIVQEDPKKLLELINNDEELKIELADVIRWQRSLDDYLFDVQNTWI